MMMPDWPSLWEREPVLRPEALGQNGELSFESVRTDGRWHVGIPWVRSMLVKEPEFTIRHQNDIDMAHSVLSEANLMLDRAYAALCRDAAARHWLDGLSRGLTIARFKNTVMATLMDDEVGGLGTVHAEGDNEDEALFNLSKAILDARDAARKDP